MSRNKNNQKNFCQTTKKKWKKKFLPNWQLSNPIKVNSKTFGCLSANNHIIIPFSRKVFVCFWNFHDKKSERKILNFIAKGHILRVYKSEWCNKYFSMSFLQSTFTLKCTPWIWISTSVINFSHAYLYGLVLIFPIALHLTTPSSGNICADFLDNNFLIFLDNFTENTLSGMAPSIYFSWLFQ